MLGMSTTSEAYMTIRERIDFAIVTFIFGVLVASLDCFFPCQSFCLTVFYYQNVYFRYFIRSNHGLSYLLEYQYLA